MANLLFIHEEGQNQLQADRGIKRGRERERKREGNRQERAWMKEARKKWRRGSRKEKREQGIIYSIGLLSVNFVLNTEPVFEADSLLFLWQWPFWHIL